MRRAATNQIAAPILSATLNCLSVPMSELNPKQTNQVRAPKPCRISAPRSSSTRRGRRASPSATSEVSAPPLCRHLPFSSCHHPPSGSVPPIASAVLHLSATPQAELSAPVGVAVVTHGLDSARPSRGLQARRVQVALPLRRVPTRLRLDQGR